MRSGAYPLRASEFQSAPPVSAAAVNFPFVADDNVTPHRLSKSRFVAGVQCHKLLWWKVHEPDAVELQPDKVLQDRFDQGQAVGELATTLFPGGVLIDLPHGALEERVGQTREVIIGDAPSVFEASFLENNTFLAVDILERHPGGFHLIEVRSSTSQKPEHIPDVAVQLHVLGRAGIAHFQRAFPRRTESGWLLS